MNTSETKAISATIINIDRAKKSRPILDFANYRGLIAEHDADQRALEMTELDLSRIRFIQPHNELADSNLHVTGDENLRILKEELPRVSGKNYIRPDLRMVEELFNRPEIFLSREHKDKSGNIIYYYIDTVVVTRKQKIKCTPRFYVLHGELYAGFAPLFTSRNGNAFSVVIV